MAVAWSRNYELAPRLLAHLEAARHGRWRSDGRQREFDTIRTFWIGPSLPALEQMCLRSWLTAGYGAELYSYAPVSNLPDGVVQRDAAEILPRATLLDDAPTLEKRPFTRANIFRMALLAQDRGPWCDTDYLMLRRLPPVRDLLLGQDHNGVLCNAILWAPPEFEMMERVLNSFRSIDLPPWSISSVYSRKLKAYLRRRKFTHREFSKHHWGMHALNFFVRKHRLESQVQPHDAFYHPVVYDNSMYKAENKFDHILENPAIFGLHFFYKKASEFERAEAGSFIDWAKKNFVAAASRPKLS